MSVFNQKGFCKSKHINIVNSIVHFANLTVFFCVRFIGNPGLQEWMFTRMSVMAWGVHLSPTLGGHNLLPVVLRASTKAPGPKQPCWTSTSDRRTTLWHPASSSSLHGRTKREASGPTPTRSDWALWPQRALVNTVVPVFSVWKRTRRKTGRKTNVRPPRHCLVRLCFVAKPPLCLLAVTG